MRVLTLAAALALTACAPKPPVTVAVPVPCLRADQVPPVPARLPQPIPRDARDALALALASLADWKAYGAAADPMLRACAE